MSGQVISSIADIGSVNYGLSKLFNIISVTSGQLASRTKDQNTIIYSPEETDSIISGNQINNKQLLINNMVAIDFNAGTMSTNITIEANGDSSNGLSLYDVMRNGTKVGTLAIYKKTATLTDADVKVDDSVTYDKTPIFTDGSTNGAMGIGIFTVVSSYSKSGYPSIEDSTDPLAGI